MRPARKEQVESDLLDTLLQELADEVLVFAAGSWRIVQANQACSAALHYSPQELLALTPFDLLAGPRHADSLSTLLASLQGGRKRKARFKGELRRKDGTTLPIKARLLRARHEGNEVFVLLADPLSPDKNPGRVAPGLQAIISHIPGMAFQVFRGKDGSVSLPYVSEKSKMLLGIEARALRANPALFFDLVLPEDKPSYLQALAQAGGVHLTFNWEGRIWVEEWRDVKWVSCRVSRRKLPDGTMWDGIMLNITHSKQAEAEIKRSREELSALTSHVHTVKEQERLRIAREIHDELGGYLSAIKIGLTWLSHNLPADARRPIERTQYLDSVVDRTIEAIHRIAADLRPPLVDFGIVAALEWQARQFSQDFGIPCEFHAQQEHIVMDPDASIAVFRIAQEALTNVARHAGASRASVRIGLEQGRLRLEIADDGVGLPTADTAPRKRSYGILGMTERATALGGELQIHSLPGKGTTLSLSLPVTPTEQTPARGEPVCLQEPSAESGPAFAIQE